MPPKWPTDGGSCVDRRTARVAGPERNRAAVEEEEEADAAAAASSR